MAKNRLAKVVNIGDRFGRLVVTGVTPRKNSDGQWVYSLQCDCKEFVFRPSSVLNNKCFRSCGCYASENIKRAAAISQQKKTTHGMTETRLYGIWCDLKKRCKSLSRHNSHCYAGKGITVCSEWANDFTAFMDWAVENGYADDLTIDRKNNDLGYCPDNCQWATKKEQARNRRTNLLLTIEGETKCAAEWAEDLRCLVSSKRIISRKLRGWDDSDAVLRPPKKSKLVN